MLGWLTSGDTASLVGQPNQTKMARHVTDDQTFLKGINDFFGTNDIVTVLSKSSKFGLVTYGNFSSCV